MLALCSTGRSTNSKQRTEKAGWIGTCTGPQRREIYKTLDWGEGEEEDPVKVLDKLEAYVRPRKKSKHIARHKLKLRKRRRIVRQLCERSWSHSCGRRI